MTVTKITQSQNNLPLQPLSTSGNNLLYTIQMLFMRVTSQLSIQNQESQKRHVQTKRDYRISTARTAELQKEQGNAALRSTIGTFIPSVAAGAGVYFGLNKNFLEVGSNSIGTCVSAWQNWKGAELRKDETKANGEAQIFNAALSDSQPKGDESTLKNVLDQVLDSIRRTYQSASR